MIIGNIKDFKPEYFTSPNIKKAIEWANSHDLLNLQPGKTVIDGDNLWVNRQSYVGKKFEEAKIEGHEKYLDLQLVLKGVEGMGYVDKRKAGLTVTSPYDEVKDKANYEGQLDGIINLRENFFALVFPEDLHKPCLKVNDEVIEKAVFKIKIDW
jgi:YhcH/YjgK/YiaL family protein